MNLLALDTSTPTAALAVVLPDGRALPATTDPAGRHGRLLVPAIRDLLARAGLAPADLGGIAVGLGPGSYTGLRVGLMAAKALAYAVGCPLLGLDSLEVVARNAPGDALRVAVVADAQRGDLYVADFAREAPGRPLVRLGPTRIESADGWSRRPGGVSLVLGPAVGLLGDRVAGADRSPDPAANFPDPDGLASLARDAWSRGDRSDPWTLEPFYLRRSSAEDKWESRT